MKRDNYVLTSAIIFGIVSILHFLRAFNSLPLIIGTWELPVWLSWGAFLFVGFMFIWAFRIMRS